MRPLKALVGERVISRMGTRTSLWIWPSTQTRLEAGSCSEEWGSKEVLGSAIMSKKMKDE